MKIDTLLKDVLINLNQREKDIFLRRYGVYSPKETLAKIAKDYNLTRERIRQIQNKITKTIIPIIRNHSQINRLIEETKKVLNPLGVKKEETFFKKIQSEFNFSPQELNILKVFYIFSEKIYYHQEDEIFRDFYAHNENVYNLTKHLLKKIHDYFLKTQKIISEDELIALVLKEIKYHFQVTLNKEEVIDFLTILKNLFKNPFGFWGVVSHSFIAPKSLKEKIRLIFHLEKRPLHYLEIHKKLTEFPKTEIHLIHPTWLKSYQPNFIKNELIRHEIFSFHGKGTYALKEWNLTPGDAKKLIFEKIKEKKIINKEELWHFISSLRTIKKTSFWVYLKELEKANKIKIKNNTLISNV